MISSINRDDKASLCVQLKNILVSEIRKENLKAGKRISGERILAEKYGVSRGTAVEALKLLEKEGYIERIGAKGTFVSDNVNLRLSTVNILFPFPEVFISREVINYSNWVTDTEIYRGLLEGAKQYNVSINFQHFEVSDEASVIMRQMKKIRGYDAVFFINNQFSSLMDAMVSENIPYIVTDISGSYSHPMTISYQRKKAIKSCADYLVDCGYDTIGILMNERRSQDIDWKMSYFQECLRERGASVNKDSIYHVPDEEEKAFEQLLEKLPATTDKLPQVFFCETMTSPLAFLRAAHERRWCVGKDIDLLGYAGETALRNTIPMLTYLKIPYLEIGREACRLLYEKVTKKHTEIIHLEIPAHIMNKRKGV